MKNQISNLQSLIQEKKKKEIYNFQKKIPGHQNIYAIASGKGGVGKTSLVLNLAIKLGKKNKKVLVMDADLGMANINILTGEFPPYNLLNFVHSKKKIKEIIWESKYGIDILPGITASQDVNNFTKYERLKMINALKSLKEYDYIFIDLPSGMSKLILDYVSLCGKLILVTTPEPTSLADGYGLLKILKNINYDLVIYTVFNRCLSYQNGIMSVEKLRKLFLKHFKSDVHNLGFVLKNNELVKSIYKREPIAFSDKKGIYNQDLNTIVSNLEEESNLEELYEMTEEELLNLI